MQLVSGLYSAALLLRTGGYFLRIILAVRVLVAKQFMLLTEPPLDSDVASSKAFLELVYSA
eukprot:4931877-Alexandrium_andersonii.AAC.1